MKKTQRQFGMTLIEITVVVVIIAALVSVGVPAVRALMNSFQNDTAVRSMVDSVLTTARTLAMAEQNYIGVHFQRTYDPNSEKETPQYMILVEHSPETTGYAAGFHARMGHKPIQLPESFAVVDVLSIAADVNDAELTTFSILFTPSGKLTTSRDILIRNRDGKDLGNDDQSNDRVFNTSDRIESGFEQPIFLVDNPLMRNRGSDEILIVDMDKLTNALSLGQSYEDYLQPLIDNHSLLISPMNGQLIGKRP